VSLLVVSGERCSLRHWRAGWTLNSREEARGLLEKNKKRERKKDRARLRRSQPVSILFPSLREAKRARSERARHVDGDA